MPIGLSTAQSRPGLRRVVLTSAVIGTRWEEDRRPNSLIIRERRRSRAIKPHGTPRAPL